MLEGYDIRDFGSSLKQGLSDIGDGLKWLGFWLFLAVSCNTGNINTICDRYLTKKDLPVVEELQK